MCQALCGLMKDEIDEEVAEAGEKAGIKEERNLSCFFDEIPILFKPGKYSDWQVFRFVRFSWCFILSIRCENSNFAAII